MTLATKAVDVLIVGAGPAGMVVACLLARAGRKVLVIERNEDFEREYRGEILQPRFHRAMMDIGLHAHVKAYPHEQVEQAHFYFEGRRVGGIQLARLDPAGETTWWMTQPDLLTALHDYATLLAGYEIWFSARIQKLEGHLAVVEQHGELVTIEPRVVIGADGRFSAVRRLGDFDLAYDRHDLDVLWFSLSRPEGYEHIFSFFLGLRHSCLVLPKYPDLLQCGLVLKPGEYQDLRKRGIDDLRAELARAHPAFASFAEGLEDFSPFHLLKGNRACVREWARDRILLIGDAAHTCSPAGGIGVAIAVETAAVAAGVLLDCFAKDDFSKQSLGEVQRARQRQIREVHRIQSGGHFFVRTPALLRRLVPVLFRTLSTLGLLRPMAARLLAQRGPLPLYGLARGSLYPDELTVGEALERYFARSGFNRSSYTDRWVRLPVGPFSIFLPNIKPRREVVPLHDVDHVVSEYEADWRGEMGITGFELGTGLGRYWFGWVINLQGIWLGLLLFPRVIFAAFVRGRRSGSVFRKHDCNAELLGKTVGEVRNELPTAPKHGHTRRPSDFLAFAGMLLLSLVVHLPLLALGIWVFWVFAVAVQQF